MKSLFLVAFLLFLATNGYKITTCTDKNQTPWVEWMEAECVGDNCIDLTGKSSYAIKGSRRGKDCCYTYYLSMCYNASLYSIYRDDDSDCPIHGMEKWTSVNKTYQKFSVREHWKTAPDGTLKLFFNLDSCSYGNKTIEDCPQVYYDFREKYCSQGQKCNSDASVWFDNQTVTEKSRIIVPLPSSTIVCKDKSKLYRGFRCGPGDYQKRYYCANNCSLLIHPDCSPFANLTAIKETCTSRDLEKKPFVYRSLFSNNLLLWRRSKLSLESLGLLKPTKAEGLEIVENKLKNISKDHPDTNGTIYNFEDAQLHIVVTTVDQKTYNSTVELGSSHINFTLQTNNVNRIAATVFVYKTNATEIAQSQLDAATRYIASQNTTFIVITGWNTGRSPRSSNNMANNDQLSGSASFVVPTPLSEPVCTKIEEEQKNTSNLIIRKVEPICLFFDEALKDYSDVGCVTSTDKSASEITCKCNHLTIFTALLAVETLTIPIGVKITSYTTESTSIVALIATIAILRHFRGTGDRSYVQINLSLSLLLLHAVNMFHDLAVMDERSCVVFTVVNQYCLLLSGMWFLLEGIYILLSTSFMYTFRAQDPHKRLKIFVLIGWMIPIFVVGTAVSVGFSKDMYMKPQPIYQECHKYENKFSPILKYDRCWLAPGTSIFYATVFAPLALVLTINFMIILKTTHVIFNLRRMGKKDNGPGTEDALRAAKSFFIFFPMLGGTWILAFFTGSGSNISSEVLMYIHSLVNGSQGILVFLLYCGMNDVIRQKFLSLKNRVHVASGQQRNTKITAASSGGETTNR